ncbi:hypothetical protein FLONG3_4071 [Fusarium longipes]|uniref:BZIP domain-containing protein n=1 Tax=Fusarium longipes TaxID=694270 RepID=A0A395SZU3_9HYPO|nr:hypothetical protein FLONG3_4071 [Fusarium longipes]
MQDTENQPTTSRKPCRGGHDSLPSSHRRVLTSARREQNRRAQQAYRERLKEEKKRLKKSKDPSRNGNRFRPILKRHDPNEEQPENMNQLVRFTDETESSTFPDVYLNMLQFFPTAFFGSCLANAASLGFDLKLVANCSAEQLSPFYQPTLSNELDRSALVQRGSGLQSSFNNTSIPEHLRPTMAQILIPHHVSLDLIPLPFLRERAIMLSAALPHTFNAWELKLDVYERSGLTIWRLGSGKGSMSRDSYPPWDMKSWEAAPWFLAKWCAVIGDEYEKLHQQSIGWQVVRDMISSKAVQPVSG